MGSGTLLCAVIDRLIAEGVLQEIYNELTGYERRKSLVNNQPLAEIFGFAAEDMSSRAERYRKNRLCPYNNRVANCTKDKANDPLGVCSVYDSLGHIAITCPIRFRQDWIIAEDAANFFFPDKMWTSLTEVRLNDGNGVSAGNIDVVLVAYDDRGRILDFGSLEVQAVYISGNVRRPFEEYMLDPVTYLAGGRSVKDNRPRPDYLSSSRKRLVPQLIYKGSILKSWNKKQAVALHQGFYDTLPALDEVDASSADVAWLIYGLERDDVSNSYQLKLHRTVYTLFKPSLDQITTPQPGHVETFLMHLQDKLDEKLDNENNPPDAPTLDEFL
jgi:hypothetical protein